MRKDTEVGDDVDGQLAGRDDLSAAIGVVCIRYTADAELPPITHPRARQFGEMFVFSDEEIAQLTAIQELVTRFALQARHDRPLSIAVFGPPGSGKSFAVKQICAQATQGLAREGAGAGVKLLRPETLNMTQVPNATALAGALARIADGQKAALHDGNERTVPIVFFDEFDAPHAGAPFGWLSWFLAPMQDGEFLSDGRIVTLKRAIYVFAGGTAETMRAFSSARQTSEFRAAKGPDFVSRLRGFLDVAGPNAEPRAWRRAVILRHELRSRARALGMGVGIEPAPDVAEAFLRAGRYVHGARSIAAVVEMSDVVGVDGQFRFEHLPENHLLAAHADLGPLDANIIGGPVALSGYGGSEAESREVDAAWRLIFRGLWEDGATLTYGGLGRNRLLGLLTDDVQQRPRDLRRTDMPSATRLVVFRSDESPDGLRGPDPDAIKCDDATEEFGDVRARWLRRTIERFQRRLWISELSVARFAIAGKTSDYKGRFPGIAEELMLSLAMGRPIYVSGAWGGAARDVGTLLGLGDPWMGETLSSFVPHSDGETLRIMSKFRERFQLSPWPDLPATFDELVQFFRARRLGVQGWPDNGLNAAENRALFCCDDAAQVSALVTRGLTNRFGYAASRS